MARNTKNYFAGCETLEDVKKVFHKMAFALHPDRGGDEEEFKKLNNQYEKAFKKYKNIHKNVKGETYEKDTQETPAEFRDLIFKLMKISDIIIEVVGSFVWVSGDTKPNKEALKELGFKFSSQKAMWYKAPVGYRKKSRAKYSMDEVRNMWGVQYSTKTGSRDDERLALN